MSCVNPKAIARQLTQAQRLMLIEGVSCGTADQMVDLGLWREDPKLLRPYYLRTPLGDEVRAILQSEQPEQSQ